jgi:hypothetical protein
VVLLDRGCHDAAGSDAVAAHDQRALRSVLVEEASLERLGEPRLQLEDVPDFDRHL